MNLVVGSMQDLLCIKFYFLYLSQGVRVFALTPLYLLSGSCIVEIRDFFIFVLFNI